MGARRTADEIVDAIEHAARELFTERTPAAVPLREIADRAGVNLGQIHRYVGSKDDVVDLVLARHADRMQRLVDTSDTAVDGLFAAAARFSARSPETGPLLAGMLADGIEIFRRRRDYPLLHRLIDQGMAPADAVVALSSLLGWEVFGRSLLEAAGVDADETDVAEALAGYVRHLLPR